MHEPAQFETRLLRRAALGGDRRRSRSPPCSPSTTWCCCRSGRTDTLLLHPGDILAEPRPTSPSTPTADVLKAASEGGQGLLGLLGNSALVALATVVVTLAAVDPRGLRGQPAEVRRRRAGHRAVPRGVPLPVDPAGGSAVRVFSRIGLRDCLVGLLIVYVAQTVPVSIYMLQNYFDDDPGEHRGGRRARRRSRLGTMRRSCCRSPRPRSMATGLYVFMIAWNEFLFALLFLAEDPYQVDGVAGPVPAGRRHGGAEDRADGGLGRADRSDVVMFYAAERMLTEGLTSGADKGMSAACATIARHRRSTAGHLLGSSAPGQARTRGNCSSVTGLSRSTVAPAARPAVRARVAAARGVRRLSTGAAPRCCWSSTPTPSCWPPTSTPRTRGSPSLDLAGNVLAQNGGRACRRRRPAPGARPARPAVPRAAATGRAACRAGAAASGCRRARAGRVRHRHCASSRRSCRAGTATRSASGRPRSRTPVAPVPVLVDNDANLMALGEQQPCVPGLRRPLCWSRCPPASAPAW